MMKYLLFIFLAVLLSCTKEDSSNCSVCTTTWIISTDLYVEGFPKMTTSTVELCDLTSDQLSAFEEATQSSESNTVDNVVYSSSHSTRCTAKQK
jgi:hypothetical protein